VLAVVAGLAAAFAHPPFGFLPGLLGYAVLLWLTDNANPTKPLRSAFFRGWLAGLGYFTVSTWWIAEAFFVNAAEQGWMAPFAVTFMAAGLALFWGGAAVVYRLLAPKGAIRVLVFAGAFGAFEWLRGNVLTGFPWDLPGETWRAGSAPSQAASLVGAYGLTWITLAVVATPGLGWRPRDAKAAIGLGIAGVIGLYAFGLTRLSGAVATPAPGAPMVRVVQPDTPELPSYNTAQFFTVLHKNLTLTSLPAARQPDIIVWSEAGVPAALDDYLSPGTWTHDLVVESLQPGQTLITGGYRAQSGPNGTAYFNTLRAIRRQTAMEIETTATYDKYRLVPFGEYLPLDRWLAPLGVKELIHVGDGFTPGPPPRPISPAGVPPLQPLICYESLFPGFTRDGARAAHLRPAWIANISDDAWFGVTSGPWQHLNLASYRAIEEGLPMVRATPTGVSAVIDAYGRVLPGKLLGQGAYGAIDALLPPALPPTLFDHWGETPFLIMLLASLAAALPKLGATLRRNGQD
jgi:apolipoprotein N-acyltransferase